MRAIVPCCRVDGKMCSANGYPWARAFALAPNARGSARRDRGRIDFLMAPVNGAGMLLEYQPDDPGWPVRQMIHPYRCQAFNRIASRLKRVSESRSRNRVMHAASIGQAAKKSR